MNKTALITGAEQGLGKAIAESLRELDYDVFNVPARAMRMGKTSIELAISNTGHSFFDIVINNFGINHLSKIGETEAIDQSIMDINVMAPYWVVNCLWKLYLDRTGLAHCRVINVASQTHRVPQRCTALYCASKAALVHMTKVMARELAPHWQVNAVAPGRIVGTEMDKLTQAQITELRGWNQEEADAYALKMIPMGRFTTTHEVTEAILLMLQMPRYVTGATLDVTGGI